MSMPDLKSIQTCRGADTECIKSVHGSRLCPTNKTVTRRVKAQREIGASLEDNTAATECSAALHVSESQDIKKHSVIQAKKIDIKLPCLDTNQES